MSSFMPKLRQSSSIMVHPSSFCLYQQMGLRYASKHSPMRVMVSGKQGMRRRETDLTEAEGSRSSPSEERDSA